MRAARKEIDYEECFFLFVVLLSAILFSGRSLLAQTEPEGIWQGYDGERRHVSRQLIALAEATPVDKIRAARAGGSLHQRSVHVHRGCKSLSTERDGAKNAGRFGQEAHG
jgi:hypothetical protein